MQDRESNLKFKPDLLKPEMGNLVEAFHSPHERAVPHFWEGIAHGKYKDLSEEQIEQLLQQRLQDSGPSMQTLNSEQKEEVMLTWKRGLTESLNREIFRLLATDSMAYVPTSDKEKIIAARGDLRNSLSALTAYSTGVFVDLEPNFYHLDTYKKLQEYCRINNYGPLSQQDKLELITNPVLWFSSKFDGCPIHYQGISNGLKEYGLTNNDEFNIVAAMGKQKQRLAGSRRIRIMDIGGGIGFALNQLKEAESNIETYNLTTHQDIHMLKSDHVILTPAEFMPEKLNGQMDLIISYMSIRYHTYPGATLLNGVRTLAVGGEMMVSFSFESSALTEPDIYGYDWSKQEAQENKLYKHLDDLLTILRTLRDNGIISGNIPNTWKGIINGHHFHIKKLKSLE